LQAAKQWIVFGLAPQLNELLIRWIFRGGRVQCADFKPLQFALQVPVGSQIDTQFLRNLEIVREATEPGGQRLDRLTNRPPFAP
jgi:hypothetical protein